MYITKKYSGCGVLTLYFYELCQLGNRIRDITDLVRLLSLTPLPIIEFCPLTNLIFHFGYHRYSVSTKYFNYCGHYRAHRQIYNNMWETFWYQRKWALMFRTSLHESERNRDFEHILLLYWPLYVCSVNNVFMG